MNEKPRTKSSYAKLLALTPYSTPTTTNNKFSALASSSRSYVQATQKWPSPSITIPPDQIRLSPQNHSPFKNLPDSPYFEKSCPMTIKLLEKDEINMDRTPIQFKIFPTADHKIIQYFLPKGYLDPPKDQEFYEFILVDTDSAEITHRKDPSSDKIAYSKCKILKFITKEEWGNPNQPRSFSQRFLPSQYNYFDYEEAWYNTFFIRPKDHSWFFRFCQNFNKKIPSWIHQWWIYFGLCKDILPEEGQKAWDYFQEKIKKVSYGNKSIMFAAEFQVPWILSWELAVSSTIDHQHPPMLERKFKIKWWRNFQLGDLFYKANIDRWLITYDKLGQFPNPEKLSTPPQSSNKSLTKKELKKKLLEEISQLGDSDDEQEDVGSSQPRPTNIYNQKYFQDSQDPYEDFSLI